MNVYRADLHIHTVLSPCGSLEMSPARIIQEAEKKDLDILAITDHNSTRQCRVIMEMGKKAGITVWGGAEINTREEVHCLVFFDDLAGIERFQNWLDKWLMVQKNSPDYFGDQVWVDKEENILGEEDRLLIMSLDRNLDQCYDAVHEMGGLFVPAHIDRSSNSLTSQLGFVPPDIGADALEISPKVSPEQVKMQGWDKMKPLLAGSDAHQPEIIGTHVTIMEMKNTGLDECRKALAKKNGRYVLPRIME
ncbi:MAG: PHP domain-containing protein [Bacteroidota bacterium]